MGFEKIELLPDDEKIKLNLFDFLIRNTDRHGGNFLIKDGQIVAINHGSSLNYPFVPHFYFFGRERPLIPREIRDKILKLNSSEDMKTILKSLLLEILPQEDVDNFFGRLEGLTQLLKDPDWCYVGSILNQMA